MTTSQEEANMSGRRHQQQRANVSHSYNAIKLTNYFTNLLHQKHHHQQQLISNTLMPSTKNRSTNDSNSGKEWRTQQLDYQIPQQDIKLLAMPPSGANELAATKRDTESNDKGKHHTIGDEIKFIRGQRKAASQFKASLYYLNPCIASGHDATQRTTVTTTTSATAKDAKNSYQRLRERNTNCFKCKKSIESGTTCVRVDNLMQDEVRTRNQQEGEQEEAMLVPNAASKEAKCSSHENNQQNNNHLCQQRTREAIFQISNEDERCSKVNKENITKSESEKSSSDEGLGSGTSSQSNSAAGSHCDDRETPPHIDHHHHLHHRQEDRRPADLTGTTTTTCDTNHLNEISSDSLEVSTSTSASKTKTHKRHKSIGGGGGGEKNGKLFSRKNRALTWSASLGSLGASLKFGAGCTSSSKSRSDTNLPAREDEYELPTGHSELKPTSAINATEDTQPIFFHTDCFSCATCHEVLVDLRALIYVNDSSLPSSRKSKEQEEEATKQEMNAADSEYINLPQDHQLPQRKVEDDNEDNQQQISLYCHRHFVELFKPRCQQCDCLILDEECTEAEGKVWHIKHFCCAECKVPLGGHQYIIVDQTLEQARHQRRSHSSQATGGKTPTTGGGGCGGGGSAATSPTTANSQPYCLRCFDKNFGETCVACRKLITCDSGAINHEQRSWHASAQCFRCAHCLRSLLGCPFLPSSQDGRIYCSVRCSDQMVGPTGSRVNPLAVPPKPNAAQVQNLSLANYLDPRAMPSAVQHELELNKSTGGGGGGKGVPSRHKQLVDHLVANARSDETSYQLLRYLQVKFEKSLAEGQTGGRQDRELADRIAQALAVLERERASASDQERARRNALNPFLVDSDSQQHNQLKRPFMEPQDRLVCMMMDRVLDETSAQFQQHQHDDTSRLQDYINLDCLVPLTVNSKPPETGSGKRVTPASGHIRHGGGAMQATKLSQCSPVASLISNEGTISDHSATSSGVSTAPPGNNSANGSLKSHSPLSSTSSHDSSASTGGGGGSGVLHHRQASSCSGGTPATCVSSQPLRASPAINSIAASLERRRRVQPITELSVVDLLTVADQVDHHHQQQQQQQQPFMSHYNQPTKAATPPGCADGFDQLVSQFGTVSAGGITSGAPVTAALKKQQQQKGGLKLPFGASSCAANKAGKQQNQTGGASGKQQPDSFFFELAQRLPRAARGLVPTATIDTHQQQASGIVQVATSGPLDTNGLPTVDSETLSSACESGAPTARTITDHYSTVNKAHKQQQHQQRQMADERDRRTRDNFFAITSPLLECQVDAPLTSTGGSQLALNSASDNSTLHPSQLVRPTSSLSIFAGDNNGAPQHQLNLHGSYSTSSLNRGRQQQHQTATLSTTTNNQQQQQQQQQQKPLTRPAKSVSFDPNVKDPPSSSTMTLGRAAALKSALKQTQQQQQQQQQQLAWQQQLEMLAAADLQTQMSAAASSATMPASFAAQLKATSGSMAAYSAHYDEFGRRIKLSTLQQLRQLQQQPQFVSHQDPNASQVVAQDDNQAGSKLTSLPGGSLLAKLGSRGGRREERKMRREQQLPDAGAPVLTQPGSLPMLAANNEHLLMPSTSGLQQQQQSLIIETQDVSPAASSSRRSSHSVGSSSSRRAASSRRTSGSHKHSSYRRERTASSAQNRRRRSSKAPVCKSRNCRDPKCLCDDTEDEDTNYSSSCSTCSSSQSYDDESEDDRRPRNHRRNYNSRHRRRRRHGRTHRASRSQRYISTTSSSECDSYSDDDYSTDDVYDSDDASSYTSYTSASGSDSEQDGRSNQKPPNKVDDDEDNGGAYADEDQQSRSSTSPGEARHNRSSSRKRRDLLRSASTDRSKSSKSSRSSDSTLVSNRSSSFNARHVDRRNHRHQRRSNHQHPRSSHRSAPIPDRHHNHHSRSRRSSNSSGRSEQHQRRSRNLTRHHHHPHPRQSSAHLEPQTPVMAPGQLASADILHPEVQLLHARNQLTAANLVRSPSSMSNDSKMAKDESCRII